MDTQPADDDPLPIAALQRIADLEIQLATATEHSDAVMDELAQVIDRLNQEIGERRRAEERLQQLLDLVLRQKEDMEILVQTLAVHGDEMEAQWWRAACEAREKMSVDALTGLANRRRFDDQLAEQWTLHQRLGQPLALVMCDVDHFKAYNDTFGHPAGDLCLQRVAGVLRDGLERPNDLAARYGGEEFALIFPGTGLDDAVALAQRLRAALAGLAIPHRHPHPISRVTMSMGVAVRVPGVGEEARILLDEADAQLYAAKSLGRNRVAHSQPSGERQ